MNVKKYRKKAYEVEAIKFDGWNWAECQDFIAGEPLIHPSWLKEEDSIEIGNGRVAYKGEWIVKCDNGAFYAYKDDFFNEIYEVCE